MKELHEFTIICDPLWDDVDVVLVSGQQVGVVDEFLRVRSLPGDDHDAVVPDDGGEVVLVPEPGHGEALQQVRAAQQLEGDGALGGAAEGGSQSTAAVVVSLASFVYMSNMCLQEHWKNKTETELGQLLNNEPTHNRHIDNLDSR